MTNGSPNNNTNTAVTTNAPNNTDSPAPSSSKDSGILNTRRTFAQNHPAAVLGGIRVFMLFALIIIAGVGLVANQIQHRWYSSDYITFLELHTEGVGTVDREDWACDTLKFRFTGALGLGIIAIVLFFVMAIVAIISIVFEISRTRLWYGEGCTSRDEKRRTETAAAEEHQRQQRMALEEADEAARPDNALVTSGFPYRYPAITETGSGEEEKLDGGEVNMIGMNPMYPDVSRDNGHSSTDGNDSGPSTDGATAAGASMHGASTNTMAYASSSVFDDEEEAQAAEEFRQLMAIEAINSIVDDEEQYRIDAFGRFGGPLHIVVRIFYVLCALVAFIANLVAWGVVGDYYHNSWCNDAVPKNNDYKYGSGFILLVTVWCCQICVFLMMFLEQSARLGQRALWRTYRENQLGMEAHVLALQHAREPRPITAKRHRNRHVLPFNPDIPRQLELFMKMMTEEELGQFLRSSNSFKDLKAFSSFRQHRLDQSVRANSSSNLKDPLEASMSASIRRQRAAAKRRTFLDNPATADNVNASPISATASQQQQEDRLGASFNSIADANEVSYAESHDSNNELALSISGIQPINAASSPNRSAQRNSVSNNNNNNNKNGPSSPSRRTSTNQNPIVEYYDAHPSANASRDPSASPLQGSPNRNYRYADGTHEPFES